MVRFYELVVNCEQLLADYCWPLVKNKFVSLCAQLLTGHAATGAIERYFSSYLNCIFNVYYRCTSILDILK